MQPHKVKSSAELSASSEVVTVSLFHSLSTRQFPRSVTLAEVHQLILSDPLLKEQTEKYRYFLEQGFTADAERIKRSMSPAFTPAAFFRSKRQYKELLHFTGLSLVDYDHISPEQIKQAVERLKNDPYWTLVYTTLLGKGLRIIFRVAGVTDRVSYTKAFQQGNAHYRQLLGFEYDGQVCDATRTSVICHDSAALYRSDAEAYPVNYDLLTVEEVWPNVENWLKRRKINYGPGNRNEYITQACYRLNKHGIPLEKVVEWAVVQFADYADGLDEVKRIVQVCYNHQEEHGTLPPVEVRPRKEKMPGYATVDEIETFLEGEASLRYNEITRMNEIQWKGEGAFRPITDRDESTLWRRMNQGERPVRFSDLRLVLSSEYVPSFSPFKEYFYRLPAWKEGDTDYVARLADTVTLADSSPVVRETFRRCLRKWLVAMVAGFLSDRVNHEILVLIGRQGIYKTTWFHYLLPPELRAYYVAKTNTRRMSKDDRLLMAESGLICLEEIVTMTDEEVDQIKAAASLPQVVERAAYARNKEVRPHLASFCGTGNHVQFLTDTSGNRRWLPFEVSDILSPYDHPIDYTGLYSQVMYLWQNGFVYWFDQEEIRSLERHLEHFEAPSLEEELILKHYRKPGATDHVVFRSTADILLRINAGMKQPLSAVKVGRLMKKLGFRQIKNNNKRLWHTVELSFEEIERNKIVLDLPEQGKLPI